jgi:hypothetical protein
MSNKSVKKQARKAPVTRNAAPTTGEVEFNPDYSQTKKDLRRIAILASSFFAVLIVLSFFLR